MNRRKETRLTHTRAIHGPNHWASVRRKTGGGFHTRTKRAGIALDAFGLEFLRIKFNPKPDPKHRRWGPTKGSSLRRMMGMLIEARRCRKAISLWRKRYLDSGEDYSHWAELRNVQEFDARMVSSAFCLTAEQLAPSAPEGGEG